MLDKIFLSRLKSFVIDDINKVNHLIAGLTKGRGELIEEISSYIFDAGGKRLRPLITILSARLCGYEGEQHIRLATAIEFIHTATLLHDDVVDQSNLRRGRETANNRWNDKASILVGDFLLSQAFKLMTATNHIQVVDSLAEASIIISEGEVKQLEYSSNINLEYDRYIDIISSKTAELFAAACQVSAIISAKTKEQINNLYTYGKNLGIAFQIIDDCLDYMDGNEVLGKNPGDDFREGKVTLPIIKLHEMATATEKEYIRSLFASPVHNDEDFKILLQMIKKYEILGKCRKEAETYTNNARMAIADFPESKAKGFMLEMLDFSVERVY